MVVLSVSPYRPKSCVPHVSHTCNHAPRGTSYSKHVLLAYPGSRPLPNGLEKYRQDRQLSTHHNMPSKSYKSIGVDDVQLTSRIVIESIFTSQRQVSHTSQSSALGTTGVKAPT